MAASRSIVVGEPSILSAVGAKCSSRNSVEFLNKCKIARLFFDVSVQGTDKYNDEKRRLKFIDMPIDIRAQ
jgi:hypothetical protein